jgi:hypothetical protein
MTAVPTQPELTGRDEQLGVLEAALDAARPALVLVTGRVGGGKSTLLHAVRGQAQARGWHAAPPDPSPSLVVNRDMTPKSFSESLGAWLRRSAPAVAIDAGPSLDAQGLSREVAGPPRKPAAPGERTADREVARLLKRLREAAPVMIAIDGYRPNRAFGRWFASELVPALKESRLPALVVIAHDFELGPELLEHADERLVLGALDEALTERYFRGLAAGMQPPMDEAELREYARAAAERPELLGSLSRVLALAAHEEE